MSTKAKFRQGQLLRVKARVVWMYPTSSLHPSVSAHSAALKQGECILVLRVADDGEIYALCREGRGYVDYYHLQDGSLEVVA